jgi:hypothetical protein
MSKLLELLETKIKRDALESVAQKMPTLFEGYEKYLKDKPALRDFMKRQVFTQRIKKKVSKRPDKYFFEIHSTYKLLKHYGFKRFEFHDYVLIQRLAGDLIRIDYLLTNRTRVPKVMGILKGDILNTNIPELKLLL